MNRGYIRLWRKSLDAGWIKNHKLWAFWSYCLMKASHKEYDAIVGLQIVHLMPGQFIFGRRQASKETGLSERETRTVVDALRKAENLTIKTTNKFSVITIVNWHIYQSAEIENDQLNDQQPTSNRPHTRTKEHKKITPAEFSSQISALKERYPDQETIDQAINAIQLTRKSNRIADSVRLAILQEWERHPVESVMTGIRTFLDKSYHHQGKNEKYLLGIIRNSNGTGTIDAPQGQTMKSTGSPALDEHYRSRGFRIT
jgi:hypothetical protein